MFRTWFEFAIGLKRSARSICIIGDGASITRGILRKRGQRTIGHASIRTQLEWCRKERVRHAIFSHCGSGIVTRSPETVATEVGRLGLDMGVEAIIAHDGLSIAL
jgi:hypothetical protein